MLQDINPWKSLGSDGIPPSILRTYHDSLAASVTTLINESLCTGDFPAPFKLAHVCPVLKKGDSTQVSNYRPISLLPVVSKVIELVVYKQLQAYIKTRPAILPTQQFAYREGHSCEDALSLCVNRWQRALDRGDNGAVAFLDLSKAFDRVQHDILLVELFNCGLGHTVLKWFRSYLAGRKQQVISTPSSPGPIYSCTQGVPQGSVLGLLLFSLYTRRLPTQVSSSTIQLYADDTTLDSAHRCPERALSLLEQDIQRIASFFTSQGLTLNANKTCYLHIRKPTKKRCTSSHLPLAQSILLTSVRMQLLRHDCHLSSSVLLQVVYIFSMLIHFTLSRKTLSS